ncbi:MAG: glutaredoxin domain-containing protein [Patescibacteria group bacterium]
MTVKIYSTPSCVYCKMLKEYLKQKNIAFEDADVLHNLKARDEMVQKSHQMGVPVADINGQIFVGFNRSEIARALGI